MSLLLWPENPTDTRHVVTCNNSFGGRSGEMIHSKSVTGGQGQDHGDVARRAWWTWSKEQYRKLSRATVVMSYRGHQKVLQPSDLDSQVEDGSISSRGVTKRYWWRLEGKAMSLGLDTGHCVGSTSYKDARRWTFYGHPEIFLFSTRDLKIHC